jgi:putative tricarboxylic transport membrane protein
LKDLKGLVFRKTFLSQFLTACVPAAIGIGLEFSLQLSRDFTFTLLFCRKNSPKYPEKFGTGIPDGIVASETANNACIGGAMIPLLTLGIPGDAVTAILLGAFMVNGITPGPMLFVTNVDLVYAIFVALAFSTIAMVFIEFFGLRVFCKHLMFHAI